MFHVERASENRNIRSDQINAGLIRGGMALSAGQLLTILFFNRVEDNFDSMMHRVSFVTHS